jgi:hypothetical protein
VRSVSIKRKEVLRFRLSLHSFRLDSMDSTFIEQEIFEEKGVS